MSQATEALRQHLNITSQSILANRHKERLADIYQIVCAVDAMAFVAHDVSINYESEQTIEGRHVGKQHASNLLTGIGHLCNYAVNMLIDVGKESDFDLENTANSR